MPARYWYIEHETNALSNQCLGPKNKKEIEDFVANK